MYKKFAYFFNWRVKVLKSVVWAAEKQYLEKSKIGGSNAPIQHKIGPLEPQYINYDSQLLAHKLV